MAYNKLQTMRDNIEAIRLVLRLGVEKRTAHTAEEREILRRYAGFGGIKCFLNDANELADAAKWSKSDIEMFAPFYTPSPVVDAIADSLKARCVEIRKFLKPSAGQGAFVDSFLHFYPGTETLAFLQRCSS